MKTNNHKKLNGSFAGRWNNNFRGSRRGRTLQYTPNGRRIGQQSQNYTGNLDITFQILVHAKGMVFIGEMEITEIEIMGKNEVDSTTPVTEDIVTKGSTITETLQISDITYGQYLLFKDTKHNLIMLHFINIKICQHCLELTCHNKQWQIHMQCKHTNYQLKKNLDNTQGNNLRIRVSYSWCGSWRIFRFVRCTKSTTWWHVYT